MIVNRLLLNIILNKAFYTFFFVSIKYFILRLLFNFCLYSIDFL